MLLRNTPFLEQFFAPTLFTNFRNSKHPRFNKRAGQSVGQVDWLAQTGHQNKLLFSWMMWNGAEYTNRNKVINSWYLQYQSKFGEGFFGRFYECVGHLNAWFVIGTSNRQTEEILPTPIRADQTKNCPTSDLSNWIGSSLKKKNPK